MTGRARGAVVVLVVVAAMVGLSGCFKARQEVRVKGDGSGSVVLHAELNKKAMDAVARRLGGVGTPPSLTGLLKPVDRTFPDGTKVRAVEDSDRATFDASFSFNGPDDYRRKLQQVNSAVAGAASTSDPGSIQVSRNGDVLEVALDVGSTVDAGTTDISALAGVLDRDAIPEIVVTLTMPGAVVASNGSHRGRTVTWDLLSPAAPPLLTASSKVARPGLPSWAVPAGVGLVLALLLAMVGVLVSHRRQAARGEPAVPPLPGGQVPGTFFPSPGGLPAREPVAWPSPPPVAHPGPPVPPAPAAPWPGGPVTGSGAPPVGAALPEPARPPPPADLDPAGDEPLPWRLPGAAEPGPDVGGPAAPGPPDPVADDPPSAPVTSPVPGWYADPAGGGGLRWWDGERWSDQTR